MTNSISSILIDISIITAIVFLCISVRVFITDYLIPKKYLIFSDKIESDLKAYTTFTGCCVIIWIICLSIRLICGVID